MSDAPKPNRHSRRTLKRLNREALMRKVRALISKGYMVEVSVAGARSVVHLTEKGAAELAKKDPRLVEKLLTRGIEPYGGTDLREGQKID